MVNYTRVRSALRQFWYRYWPARENALLLARVPYVGDNARRKYSWVCAMCQKHNSSADVQVDHIKECGQFRGPDDEQQFIWNLFFGELQVLCKVPCHKLKTAWERAEAARERKRLKDE